MGYITVKKSKLYPNKDTKTILNKTLGCTRFVWNQLLGNNQENYTKWIEDDLAPKPNTSVSYFNKELNKLKAENQVISLEDLNVKEMLGNRKLAKHIADCGFGIIRNMIEYKAKRFESPVQVSLVSRWYPSTQNRSGYKVKREIKLTLKDRNWICLTCGLIHDRDINAATNILNEGLRLVG